MKEKANSSGKLRVVFVRNPENYNQSQAHAYVGEVVAGIGAFVTMKDFTEINGLVVNPEFRRKGVGKQLLRALVDHCQKHYPDRQLYISAIPFGRDQVDQEVLFALYRGVGFERIKDHPFAMKMPLIQTLQIHG